MVLKNDMRSYYEQFMDILKYTKEFDKDYTNAFLEFFKQAEKTGALSSKTKELISIALSITAHCPYCIAFHVHNAFKAGATKEEILESSLVAGLMGGGPAMAHIRYVIDSIEQFKE